MNGTILMHEGKLLVVEGELPPSGPYELLKIGPLHGVTEFVHERVGTTRCGVARIVGSRDVLAYGNVRPGEGRPVDDRLGVDILLAAREDLLRHQFVLSQVVSGRAGPASNTSVYTATPPGWMTDSTPWPCAT
jgi:hypothetical protein